ncbi:MAG: zinc-binding alcohol dehydrogenase family protein [Planctomycetes bacterium]|nr:zinc-binding alcohol dehydrogenase family protein [Planctomycetota bacterium]
MKSLFITAPLSTEIRQSEKPTPSSEEALLRVRRVGYCGSDLNTFRGNNPMVALPRIPGHEVAATVERPAAAAGSQFPAGANVTISPYTSCGKCASCRRGRPNACQFNQTLGVQRDGAMAEYITVPWRKLYGSQKLSLRELALVEPLSVGFHAVERGRVNQSDVVAIFGCGAVGLGAVAGAAFRDATVVAIDIDDGKLAIAQRAGAKHAVNSSHQSLHEALREIAPDGPDVVIEAVGLPTTFKAAIEEVAFTGRVVYIGYVKSAVDLPTNLFVQKELNILGSRNALEEFPAVIRMLEQGRFPVDDVISLVVPFARAGQALAQWNADPAAITRILVDFDQ